MVSKSDTGIYRYSKPVITFTQGGFTGTLEIKDGVILLQNPNTGDMFVFFKQNIALPEAGSTDRIHGMPELAGPNKPRVNPEQQ